MATIINTNAINANDTFAAAVVAFNQAVRTWKGQYKAMYGADFDQSDAQYNVSFYSFTQPELIEAARHLTGFGGGTYGCYALVTRGLVYTHPHTVQYIMKGRRLFATITSRNDDVWVYVNPAVKANVDFLDGLEARRRNDENYKVALVRCLAVMMTGAVLGYTVGQEGGYVHFEGRCISARGLSVKANNLGYDIAVGGGKARAVLDADEDYGFSEPVKVRRQAAYNPQRVNGKLVLRALDRARREEEITSLLG